MSAPEVKPVGEPDAAASTPTSTVWLDGELLPASEATLPALDRGALYGDALFETLRAYEGRLPLFDRHMQRLRLSQQALLLDIPERPEQLRAACLALLQANRSPDAALRITLTRGVVDGPPGLAPACNPHRLIHLRPLPAALATWQQGGVTALLLEPGQRSALALAGHKTTNYLAHLLFKRRARDAGCWEAVLRAADGTLLEGASSNLFAVHGSVLHTAPVSDGLLPGVMRGICLNLAAQMGMPTCERGLTAEELAESSEAFFTNSVAEIVPLVGIRAVAATTTGSRAGGERSLGGGVPGPVSRALQEGVRDLLRGC